MKTNQAGINLIKKYEAFKSRAYICPAGVPTIGYGTTVYPNGRRVRLTDAPISESTATLYLASYVMRAEVELDKLLKVTLNANRYAALIVFIYNVGIGAFSRSTLLKVINEAPGAPGIRSEFMKWNKATVKGKKVVLRGLTIRRGEEADLYFTV